MRNILEYISQDESWMTADRGTMKIKDMDPDHRVLAQRWLIKHSQPMIMLLQSGIQEEIMAEEREPEDLSVIFHLMSQSPREWMQTTPLYQALNGKSNRHA